MMHERLTIPFTAIVGQEELKRALLLNAINPRIGGVLIRGEKGTAKSTAVRALAELLPEIEVVRNCPFRVDPMKDREFCARCGKCEGSGAPGEIERRRVEVVTLPLGVTEDRLLGTLDIEEAIQKGCRAFEPGILAACHRGILYIDEVNLLDDHIVDLLLDAAAMGVNTVEREGISFSHPSRFMLIGTMNPEEGELRPQLLDRFGLQVTISGLKDVEQRMAIVRVVERFEEDPISFRESFRESQEELRGRLLRAMALLDRVVIGDGQLRFIAEICNSLEVRTHRAEITIARTAKAIAALDGRMEVDHDDLREAMQLALPHRMRRRPFEDPDLDRRHLDELMDELQHAGGSGERKSGGEEAPEKRRGDRGGEGAGEGAGRGGRHPGGGHGREKVLPPGRGILTERALERSTLPKGEDRYASGRRLEVESPMARGRYRSSTDRPRYRELALDASIRASAQRGGVQVGTPRVRIEPRDLRFKERFGKTATACLFLVDASGSMGAMGRMESAKGAALSLLSDAYRHRDRIGLIAFRGGRAEEILPFTQSIDLASKRLRDIPTGGKTPLSHGLELALRRFAREKERHPSLRPILILLSDGHANVGIRGGIREEVLQLSGALGRMGVYTVVIDTEETSERILGMGLGYCREIAERSGGVYHRIAELSTDVIREIALMEMEEQVRTGGAMPSAHLS